MINYCKKNINEIGHLLQNLTDREYALPLTLLSGSSVGQHVRHVLEFYTSLLGVGRYQDSGLRCKASAG